ncbi:MAG: GAF domain-containing protein [Elusimicrobia bacterium]|nr:GAF domain-containing protein [Elusimicrobiota bacterium]
MKTESGLPWGLVGLAAGAALVFSLGGYLVYRQETGAIRQQKYDELRAISELKAEGLTAWRQERLDTARLNSTGLVKELAGRWLAAPGGASAKTALLKRLRAIRDEHRYASVILTAPDGRVLLSLEDRLSQLGPESLRLVSQAVSARQALMGDFFSCPVCGGVHLDTAAPIPGPGGRPAAALILRTDPERFLYPLVQSWPVPSRTAETLLVRRAGGDVLFLNRLRHLSVPPLAFSHPISRADAPSVQAALGRTGVFEGKDYRGEAVLADVRRVPDTPWFMVSKVDTKEFLSEIRYRGAVIAVLVVLGVLMAGGLGLLAHSAREIAERQRSEKRLRILLDILQHPAPDLQGFLDYALEQAIQLTESRIGYIYFYHEDRRQFVLNTWSQEVMSQCSIAEPQTVYDLDKTGIWGEAVRQRQPIIVNDFPAPHPLKKGYPEGHAPLRRFMTVPVFSDEKIVAVVGVANKEGAYDEGDSLQLSLLMGAVWKSVESMQAGKALARSEQLLHAAMDSALDAVVLMDDSGKAAYWNPAAEAIFGFSAGEVVGKDIHSILMPPRYHGRYGEGFARFLKSGAGPVVGKVLELSARHQDGREIPIEISVAAIPRDGRFWSIGVIRDIAERKKLEAQRAELFQLLSHDLRTPLTAILAAMELAGDELKDDSHGEAGSMLDIAQRGGREMLDLIRGVLDEEMFAGSMKSGLVIQPLDVEERVRQMVESMGPSARMRRVSLRLDCRLGGAKVVADKRLLHRIVNNLLSNAVKFSPEGGEVLVGLAREGAAVRVSVTDCGPGIPADFKDKVFTPRAQARPEDKTQKGGAGLGLAGVKQMVEALGGRVGFASDPGVETTFFVTLPAAGGS